MADVVLVHGFWADGSSWSGVIPLLLDAGHRVTAVQLPLSSQDDDVAVVERTLRRHTGPVGSNAALVSHPVAVAQVIVDAAAALESHAGGVPR